mgnify:CR=1 FL=1
MGGPRESAREKLKRARTSSPVREEEKEEEEEGGEGEGEKEEEEEEKDDNESEGGDTVRVVEYSLVIVAA